MKDIRFLVDENSTHAIGDQLRRRQPDIVVLTVGNEQAPPRGTLDPDILLWLEHEGYCLITRNRRSMPRHLRDHLEKGHHCLGFLPCALGCLSDRLSTIFC